MYIYIYIFIFILHIFTYGVAVKLCTNRRKSLGTPCQFMHHSRPVPMRTLFSYSLRHPVSTKDIHHSSPPPKQTQNHWQHLKAGLASIGPPRNRPPFIIRFSPCGIWQSWESACYRLLAAKRCNVQIRFLNPARGTMTMWACQASTSSLSFNEDSKMVRSCKQCHTDRCPMQTTSNNYSHCIGKICMKQLVETAAAGNLMITARFIQKKPKVGISWGADVRRSCVRSCL